MNTTELFIQSAVERKSLFSAFLWAAMFGPPGYLYVNVQAGATMMGFLAGARVVVPVFFDDPELLVVAIGVFLWSAE